MRNARCGLICAMKLESEMRNGEAKVIAMSARDRARFAREVLGVAPRDVRKLTCQARKARMIMAWLIRADGSTTVSEVAKLVGVTHGPVVRMLAAMVPWPGPATRAIEMPTHHVARAVERHRRLTGEHPSVADSHVEMAMRWMDAMRRDPATEARARVDELIGELVPGGVAWKRGGTKGNRGNSKPRKAAGRKAR